MDGFQEIVNAHVHNGRIEKRNGMRLIGYGAHHPTTFTTNGDDIASISQANPAVVTTTAAHNFSNSDQVVIIGGDMTEVVNQRFTVANVTATTFELSGINSSAYTAYTSGSKVYLSPSNSVMGITTFLDDTNQEKMMGWDTKRAFIWDYTVDGFTPLDDNVGSPSDYLGSATADFIRFTQWNTETAGNIMYFSNGLVENSGEDGLLTYDPSASPPIVRINPTINSTDEVYGCKGVEVFKNRLLLFGPYEGANAGAATLQRPRVRWCRINDPRVTGDQWRDDIRGNGGFSDAATQDEYIGHQKLLNEVIVFFTNSIWVLRYQPDPIEPFRWQKLNSYLSTRSPFGSVGYDQFAINIGNRGIYQTNGNSSTRVDHVIEQYVEQNISKENFGLLYAHRDYQNKRSYFLYPQGTSDTSNRMLVHDDDSGAFTEYEIALNVIGDGTNPTNTELLMSNFPDSEDANPLNLPLYAEDAGELKWTDYFWDLSYEATAGGGFSNDIYQMNFDVDDDGTAVDMVLTTGEWNPYRDRGIEAGLEWIDLFVDSSTRTEVEVLFYKDSESYPHTIKKVNLLPNIRNIANVSGITFQSPSTSGVMVSASNHGLQNGDIIYIYNVRGMIEINGGPWTVSDVTKSTFQIDTDASSWTAYSGDGMITMNPYDGQRVYKRVVCGAVGNAHTIQLRVSGLEQSFTMHGMLAKMTPVEGRLL
jgi:hypothetical protein